MPIRFRCRHCRQLLGIASSRAGADVPCPLCGQTIHVPAVSETLVPAGAPEQSLHPRADWHDPSLREALEILQAAGPSPAVNTESDDEAAMVIVETLPAPEIEIVEHVILPERSSVATAPAPQADDGSPPVHAAEDDAPVDWRAEIAPLAKFAAPLPHPRSDERRRLTWPIIALLLTVAAFAAGWWSAARRSAGVASDPSVPSTAQAVPAGEQPLPIDNAATPLSGRLLVRQANGPPQADAGAVVILLPVGWSTLRPPLAATGLHPADPQQQFDTAAKAIRPHGAFAAVADGQGRFAIPQAKQGDYFLLALSRFGANPSGNVDNQDAVSEMSLYLERPRDFVGRRAFRWQRVDLRNDEQLRLEIAF